MDDKDSRLESIAYNHLDVLYALLLKLLLGSFGKRRIKLEAGDFAVWPDGMTP